MHDELHAALVKLATMLHESGIRPLEEESIKEEEIKVTPCLERGYKVGDQFVLVKQHPGHNPYGEIGSVLELAIDDGSTMPCFKWLTGHTEHRAIAGEPSAFVRLESLVKIILEKK